MENNIHDFFKEINVSITISDTEGNVLYMNDKAKSVFSDMVGKNMMGCHKQSSQETIKRLINEKETNVYTIQKGDVKKMIYQTPWYVDGNHPWKGKDRPLPLPQLHPQPFRPNLQCYSRMALTFRL